jgi:DNA excision repair protein ERCC-2
MVMSEFEDVMFPYDDVRPVQADLIRNIRDAIRKQENLVAHAPTGLGKTSAALAPAIAEALKKDLTVFFLTSRHTQHKLAMDTISDIKRKYKLNIHATDLIGKRGLCLQPDTLKLSPRDFADFCQKMRDDDLCEFYTNTKQKGEATPKAQLAIKELKEANTTNTESIIQTSTRNKMCPYEMAILLARDARVIVGDYYYLFHPSIRESFLKKCNKDLSKSIVIIDEGHNLPDRLKDLATHRINTIILARAIEEARKNGREEVVNFVEKLARVVDNASNGVYVHTERYVTKSEITSSLHEEFDFDTMLDQMEEIAGEVREEQRQSYLGTIVSFLAAWEADTQGFTRILSKGLGMKGDIIVSIHYRCLDPSIITRDVIRGAYSTILMSGTLNPTHMYKEVLGFDSATEVTFKSPFPEKNKVNIIIPKTSTKYETRTQSQFKDIAEILSKITNKVPGNSAVFFPSYNLKDEVYAYFSKISHKTVFSEQPKFTKQEKMDFLERYKQYKDSGAVLFGVSAGNFSEGVDLPGDLLKCVIIVGLPLQKPDLETEALIKYYDEKFKKGWDYGYLLPAFNKTLQSAGRCIRTETDKGAIIFLDERYAWKNYFKCFPTDWNMKITLLYEHLIDEFFKRQEQEKIIS